MDIKVNGIIGRKLGMTQIFTDSGEWIPVTVVETIPGYVTQIKTKEITEPEIRQEQVVQLGFALPNKKKINKPILGFLKKIGLEKLQLNYFKEFKLISSMEEVKIGQKVDCSIFSEGEKVAVSGFSKGRGFAGVVKRWGFSGGPASHGSMFYRAPGSVGASAIPSRVLKGKRLPGHMGNVRVTVRGLTVRKVDVERNLLFVQGAVPGHTNAIVIVRKMEK